MKVSSNGSAGLSVSRRTLPRSGRPPFSFVALASHFGFTGLLLSLSCSCSSYSHSLTLILILLSLLFLTTGKIGIPVFFFFFLQECNQPHPVYYLSCTCFLRSLFGFWAWMAFLGSCLSLLLISPKASQLITKDLSVVSNRQSSADHVPPPPGKMRHVEEQSATSREAAHRHRSLPGFRAGFSPPKIPANGL